MARLFRLLAAITCLLLGTLAGVLNPQPVVLDLGLFTLQASLGPVVLGAVLMGMLVGGSLLAIGVVRPLRRRQAGQMAGAGQSGPSTRD